ncbi:MAG: hypothetical protein ACNA7W_17095 [Pseudomonadales bacterium]
MSEPRLWSAAGAGRSALLGGLVALWLLGGCSTTIIPRADVEQPATVYVVDKGRTPSLVIPSSGGGLVRYAYGEWHWYALRETGLFRGAAALLWPTRGALGRERLRGPATLSTVERHIPGAEEIHPLTVELALVRELQQHLDGLYQAHRETEVYAHDVRLHFVHHPRRYSWFWNSNHMVAAWVRDLGCDTRGLSFLSQWDVEAATP